MQEWLKLPHYKKGIDYMEKINEMTFSDVVKMGVGLDDKGNPKSVFMIKNTDDSKPLFFGGWTHFRMSYREDYITIDLVFKSGKSLDIKNIWDKLEEYGEKGSFGNELSIMPVECDGRFYILAINPVFWVLQPETVGATDLNVIRILYENEDVQAVATGALIKADDTAEELAESKLEMELHMESFDK